MKNIIVVLLVGILAISSLLMCSGCSHQTKSAEPAESERVSVENQEITINIRNWDDTGRVLGDYEESTGVYTGEVLDGVPDGIGTFTSKDVDGDTWVYEGEFTKGIMEGIGEKYYLNSDKHDSEEGHFKDGYYAPTIADIMCRSDELSEANKQFIIDNEEVFPARNDETKQKAIELSDDSITIKDLKRDIGAFEGMLFSKTELYVMEINEYSLYGYDLKTMNTFDSSSEDSYFIYDFSSLEVNEGDYINFRGLPTMITTYENTSGGVTDCIVFLGSIVEKR